MGLRKDFKDVCVVNDACEIEYIHVLIRIFGFKPDEVIGKVFYRYMQISTKPTVPLRERFTAGNVLLIMYRCWKTMRDER